MKVQWKIVMLASALLLAACQQKDQQPAIKLGHPGAIDRCRTEP